MLAKKQAELRRADAAWPAFEETEFACFTEDEIRDCTFDIRKLLLTGRGRHLAICPRCLRRLKYWSAMFERLERATPLRDGRPDA